MRCRAMKPLNISHPRARAGKFGISRSGSAAFSITSRSLQREQMRQDHQTPGREIRGYGFSPHGCRACRPRHCTFSLSRIRRIADLKLSTAGLLCSTLSRRWIAVTWSSETPGHFPCRPDCGRRLTRSIFTLCDHQILTCLRFNLPRTTIVSGNGESRNTKNGD